MREINNFQLYIILVTEESVALRRQSIILLRENGGI